MTLPPSLVWTIIKRELLTSLRSWKSFFLLLLILAVLYYVALLIINDAAQDPLGIARSMQSLFNTQIGILLAAALSIVPTIAALSICSERSDESYDLLRTTLISPARIALGKLLAILFRFLLIAVALLPFTGLVYFFAGVDIHHAFQAGCIILPTAVSTATLGLWISTLCHRPGRALILTLSLVFLVNIVLPAFLSGYLRTPAIFAILSPLGLFYNQMPGLPGWGVNLGLFASYQGGLALLCFLLTLYQLGPARNLNPLRDKIQKRLPRAVFRPPATAIPDRMNPIVYRDLCANPTARGQMGIAVFLTIFLLCAYYNFVLYRDFSGDEVFHVGPIFERFLLLLLVPPIVAINYVRDCEATTWDLLRLSLLTPRQYLFGKITAVVRIIAPLFAPLYIINCLVFLGKIPISGTNHRDTWMAAFFGELISFPLHILLVIVASLSTVCFTTRATTAALAAYVGIAVNLVIFLFLHENLLNFLSVYVSESWRTMVATHAIACTIILYLGYAIPRYRLSFLWENKRRYSASIRTDSPTPMQPPAP